MREFVATVTSKGQVTIPVEIRRRLGLGPGDKVAFVFDGDEVRLRPPRYTIESICGSVPALGRETPDFEDQIREAMEEEADRVVRRMGGL